MFSEDFYPTPGAVAAKMLQKIDRNAVHFLEPSAGKGDLAKAISGIRSDSVSLQITGHAIAST
jgi:phospholipid N-methyltransferase